MPEEKHDDFEIPSFIESKDEIDKSLFKLDKDIDLGNQKEEYIPAHSGNTNFKKEVVDELNEALVEDSREEKEDKVPLWIILIGALALLLTIVFAALILKDLFVGGDSKTPQASVAPTTTPLTTSPSASTSPSITTLPTTSPDANATAPSASPSPNAPVESKEYVLAASMNVRSGAGTDFSLIEASKMPSAYISYANGSVIKEGTVVKILEIKNVDSSKWGKIGDNAWICLADENQIYAKKK